MVRFFAVLAAVLCTYVNTLLSALGMPVPPTRHFRSAKLTDGARVRQSGAGVQGEPQSGVAGPFRGRERGTHLSGTGPLSLSFGEPLGLGTGSQIGRGMLSSAGQI